MRGRHAIGPQIAERVDGSALARARMQVILETIAGTKPVKDACAELDICEQMFERLRQKAIQAGVEALELKSAGRPPKSSSPSDEQITELKERVAELEVELQAATLKAELAATLPRLASNAGKKP